MATTTTNNGWDIPQSSDYVKNGATAIATLGQDIDTGVGTGLLAWQTWAPTFSGGWLNGNGVWTAKYALLGKIVIATGYFVVGTTTTKGTAMNVSLPVTALTTTNINGFAWCGLTSSSSFSPLIVRPSTSSIVNLFASNAAGTYVVAGDVTATAPIVWATNSVVSFTTIYQSS